MSFEEATLNMFMGCPLWMLLRDIAELSIFQTKY